MKKAAPTTFVLILIIIAMSGYVLLFQRKVANNSSLSLDSASALPTVTAAASPNSSGPKTFRFESFHGSSVSDKFRFQYPANWYNEGQYFSPVKIQYYDQYSVRAPIFFDLILADIFDQTEFKHQIDTSRRAEPDKTGKINGRDFKKYTLIDYGSYGGESSGRVVAFVGPKITVDGDQYYLVFHWEEKPLATLMVENNLKVFEDMISSLKFYK